MAAAQNKKPHTLVIILTVIGGILILFFGLRAFHAYRKFEGRMPMPPPPSSELETDAEQVREWMTIPFVSRSYGIPEEILFDSVGITPREGNRKKSLEQLNEEYFPQTDGWVVTMVKTAILAHRSTGEPEAPAPPTSPPQQTPPQP